MPTDPVTIVPFLQVGALAFGLTSAALVQGLGEPPSRRFLQRTGLTEFRYRALACRFDAADRLVEISADLPALDIEGAVIAFAALARHVRAHDPAAFAVAGFLVSPRFGLAHDPACPHWVTAFPASALALWRADAEGDTPP